MVLNLQLLPSSHKVGNTMVFILQLAATWVNPMCLVVKYMVYGTNLLLCLPDFLRAERF